MVDAIFLEIATFMIVLMRHMEHLRVRPRGRTQRQVRVHVFVVGIEDRRIKTAIKRYSSKHLAMFSEKTFTFRPSY